ncbi:MAG: non-homologous end-joining DNA ligase [bacterium]|nr:non-homologous end-joining DNA ligase [bacterium]
MTSDPVALKLTNLAKPFWPQDGYTKGRLVAYYQEVAPHLLPHLRDRYLSLTRYPDGIHGKRFYQKNIPPSAPAWIRRGPFRHGERTINYCLADSPATLVWLAQWGVIEIHPWLSRSDAPAFPDFAVFDLDPSPPAGFTESVEVAFMVRTILGQLGLRAYPKTSGATGIHIYLPLCRGPSYSTIARLVAGVADIIHEACPGRTTRERVVARRRGVYIDHLQNAMGKTLAAPYCLRPLPGAPVSAPVAWDELPRLKPGDLNLESLGERLSRVGDLFRPVLEDPQDVGNALRALGIE